jgi:type I restriction enzyme M protein
VANAVKTPRQRRLTQAELDAFLEKAADMLRGGVDHSEFRGYVFALLFYKRINDVYLENVAALEQELLNKWSRRSLSGGR